ncbi:alpha/beta fold hydrolase [Yoonia vestfoldensis]|uniref:alpha/beta fold hydrolase n=1 Tax=Yoonia vestfoldensis TaxID=245188 RepID=UPI00038297C9|nr:alpha/beta hydrolase [Yoonia vestfoldensis]
MKLEFCTIDGLRIRYAAARNPGKPQVILTSPQPMSILTYSAWWDRLAEEFDVVAVDLPNHGGSDAARHVTTVSQHARFFGKILDHFGLDHPHFIGPDIGTPMVLRYMADTPGRLKSATVGDAGCVGVVEGAWMFRGLVYSRAIQLAVLSAGGAIGGRMYCAAANAIGYRLSSPSAAAKADYLAGSTTFAKLRGQVGYLASYPDETPRLQDDALKIKTPVQVLHGEFDTFVSEFNSRRLADLLPNSQFAMIPGAGHYAWEDAAEDYLARVLTFIGDVEGQSR